MSINPDDINDDDIVVLADYKTKLNNEPAHRDTIAAVETAETSPAATGSTSHLQHVTAVRARIRRWLPGFVATAVLIVLVVTPVPATGPLIIYGLAWTVFAWWHVAGRPSPADVTVALAGIARTGWQRIQVRGKAEAVVAPEPDQAERPSEFVYAARELCIPDAFINGTDTHPTQKEIQ